MAWGYVDHPPFTVWVAWLSRNVLGDSPLAVRLLPILAGAALVWLTGKLAREMGGGRFAQAMAALAVVVVPMYLIVQSWLTDNVFEQLIWMGCVWMVIRAINTGERALLALVRHTGWIWI